MGAGAASLGALLALGSLGRTTGEAEEAAAAAVAGESEEAPAAAVAAGKSSGSGSLDAIAAVALSEDDDVLEVEDEDVWRALSTPAFKAASAHDEQPGFSP